MLPTKASRFWRCGQFFPLLLSAYWVLSAYFLAVFANKRVRLLTRVYGTFIYILNIA